MAINIRCKKCKTDMKLSVKKCKCGASIPSKGRVYRVIVRMNGRRIVRTATNLELAREIEGKLKVDIARNEHDLERKAPAPALNAIWNRFLLWAKEHKKSWRTDFLYYRKHLEPRFGEKPLDQITPFDIEKLIISMKKGKNARGTAYAPATIKHQLVLLSRLFTLAAQWNMYTGLNPCQKVKKPKLNNQITEYLTEDELTRLFDTLVTWPNRMSVSFIKFALYTGLRRGELFKLMWRDVDFERQSITIRDTDSQSGPKGKRDLVLPLSNKALEVLQTIPKEHDTLFVFYGRNGEQRTDFKGPWARIKKAADVPEQFRLHGLRHHFASSLVSAGTDLYTVSKLLTHKDITTTQRYAHLADKALRDAVNLSDQLQEPKKHADVITIEEKQNG